MEVLLSVPMSALLMVALLKELMSHLLQLSVLRSVVPTGTNTGSAAPQSCYIPLWPWLVQPWVASVE